MGRFVYRSEEGRAVVEAKYRARLDSPAGSGCVRRYIDTPEGRTFVVPMPAPEKPVLVLLHGSMANSGVWLGAMPMFAERFSVYAVDIPGEPGLSDPYRFPIASGAPAKWLEAVMDGLGLERAAILGASLGGWYTLDFAIKRPGRVTAISLLATAGVGTQKAGALALSLFLAAVRRKGEKFIQETVFRGTGAPRELIEFQYLVAMHFKPLLARLPVFGDAELRRLSMPLQYFGGEADGFVDTRKTAARFQKLVPGAQINILEGTGHLIFDETGKAADFLARAVSAR